MDGSRKIAKHMNSNIRNLMSGNEEITHNQIPANLLTPNRIDVVIKYLYARSILSNIDSKFLKNLYLRHIKNINGFVEKDDTDKIGEQAFLDSFQKMIKATSNQTENKKFLIPVNKEGQILDGAHRLSLALAYGMKSIDSITLDVLGQVYDYKFFKESSLSEEELDLVIHEYCKIKTETRGIILWPISNSKKVDPTHFLQKYGKIVYYKEIDLNFSGLVQLVRTAYNGEHWVGTVENNFQGSHNKARWCAKEGSKLTFIIFEPDKDIDLLSTKEALREFYGLDKHSMHINDTAKETMELCELLLNKNSINWLNTSNITNLPQLDHYLLEFRTEILRNNLNKDDFIILGSLLAAFGIKDAGDLDYINNTLVSLNTVSDKLELDTEKMKWIETSITELLSNPHYFYYFKGFKFLSVDESYKFKAKRKRDQDLEDLQILGLLKKNQKYHVSAKMTLKKLTSFRFYKIKLKHLAYFIRFILYKSFSYVKNIMHRPNK